jgi:hypothetical protein
MRAVFIKASQILVLSAHEPELSPKEGNAGSLPEGQGTSGVLNRFDAVGICGGSTIGLRA